MPQALNTIIVVTSNHVSAGQPVDFDGTSVSNLLITNNSGGSVQYTLDGSSWTTVANGASAGIDVVSTARFRLRKSASDGVPLAVQISWLVSESEPALVCRNSASRLAFRKAFAKA